MNTHTLEEIETRIQLFGARQRRIERRSLCQHAEIETLAAAGCAQPAALFDAAQSSTGVRTQEEERPPHY